MEADIRIGLKPSSILEEKSNIVVTYKYNH